MNCLSNTFDAIAFNLKKLLKHQPKHVLRLPIVLPKLPATGQQLLPFWWRKHYYQSQQLGNRKHR
jgi:hypothetical protein